MFKTSKNRFALVLCLLLAMFAVGSNSATASAWKLSRNIWSEEDEKIYSDFVERIGDSKYSNLNKFIRDSKVNPLYGEEDKKFNLSPDCADLPYVLRAYVAYKLRLPFSYVSAISSKGGDQRYGRGNKPDSFKDQDFFKSPQQLFNQVTLVNSGYFRTGPDVEDADFYPVKVSRKTIIPGTIYYDPDGHVALVTKVVEDGRIRVIDAHPDRTISKPWFGAKFTRGTKANGGGFKRWRPIRYTSEGKIIRTRNHNIVDYSADDQYHKTFAFKGRSGLSYHEYIRLAMADESGTSDPVKEFVFMMKDLHEDIAYRAEAVKLSVDKGINARSHPGALPWNIYGTDGIWEEFSTPSRDARLKVAFREFYDRTRQMILFAENDSVSFGMARELAVKLLRQYEELSPLLTVSYINSVGNRVVLNFNEVSERLFDLSFDPYHSIEYRWGAKGDELSSANDSDTKRRFYDLERKLRNQLERVYNQATPLSMGPEVPPAIDVRGWLIDYLSGNKVDSQIVAINREIIAPVVAPVVALEQETAGKDALPALAEVQSAVPPVKTELASGSQDDFITGLLTFGDNLVMAMTDEKNYFADDGND